jgi:hypothetical protein
MVNHAKNSSCTKVIDIGGNAFLHRSLCTHIHSTMPITCTADKIRHGRAENMKGLKFCRCTLKDTLTNTCQKCKIDKQTYVFSNHVLYYLKPVEVCSLIKKCSVFRANIHIFDTSPTGSANNKIEYGPRQMEEGSYTYEEKYDGIAMHVPGEKYLFEHASLSYLYDGKTFCKNTTQGSYTWKVVLQTVNSITFEFSMYDATLKKSTLAKDVAMKNRLALDKKRKKRIRRRLTDDLMLWYIGRPVTARMATQLRSQYFSIVSKLLDPPLFSPSEVTKIINDVMTRGNLTSLNLVKNINNIHLNNQHIIKSLNNGGVTLYDRLILYCSKKRNEIHNYVLNNPAKTLKFAGIFVCCAYTAYSLIGNRLKAPKTGIRNKRMNVKLASSKIITKNKTWRETFMSALKGIGIIALSLVVTSAEIVGSLFHMGVAPIFGLIIGVPIFICAGITYVVLKLIIIPVVSLFQKCFIKISNHPRTNQIISGMNASVRDHMNLQEEAPVSPLHSNLVLSSARFQPIVWILNHRSTHSMRGIYHGIKAFKWKFRYSYLYGLLAGIFCVGVMICTATYLSGLWESYHRVSYERQYIYGQCNADLPLIPLLDDARVRFKPKHISSQCTLERMYINVGPVSILYKPISMAKCPHNDYDAIVFRVIGDLLNSEKKYVTQPKEQIVGELIHFVNFYIKELFGDQKSRCCLSSFKQWINHFKKPDKKQLYMRVAEEFDYSTISPDFIDRHRFVQCFTKTELLAKQEGSTVHSRIIQGRDPLFNMVWAILAYSLSNCLKTVWGIKDSELLYDIYRMPLVTYTSGLNRDQMSELYERDYNFIDSLPGETVRFMSDFSKMDRHERICHLYIAWSIVKHFYAVTPAQERCFQHMLFSTGYMPSGLKYSMYAQLKSGEQWTSSFNSLITGVGWLFSVWKACGQPESLIGLPIRIHVHGDDSNGITKRWVFDMIKKQKIWEGIGFTIKLHQVKLTRLEFCSSIYVPSSHGIVCVPKPGRVLLKTFYLLLNNNTVMKSSKEAAYVYGVCEGLFNDLSVFPFMVVLLTRMMSLTVNHSDARWFRRFTKHKYFLKPHLTKRVQPTDATYAFIYERYGIDKCMVSNFNKYVSRITHYNVALDHFVVSRLVEVDAYDLF